MAFFIGLIFELNKLGHRVHISLQEGTPHPRLQVEVLSATNSYKLEQEHDSYIYFT